MDIQDVSQDAHYAQILLAQRARLEAARARKGEIPKDRQTRQKLAQDHVIQYKQFMALKSQKPQDTYMTATLIGEPYLPSVAPIEALEKIPISQLKLETHHRGFYLLLRLFVQPVRMTAVITLAEDEAGDALSFSLYQQESEGVRPAAEILPKDTVLLLKEPYFKAVVDGGYGLRVDHPTDVVFLSDNDPRVPSSWRKSGDANTSKAEEWKQKGNSKVQAGKYRDAVKDYTAALDCSPTPAEAEIIHNNRALAYLRLHHYDAALEDTAFLVDPNDRSEKALYRGALALYNLGRYSECQELLKTHTAKFPTSEAGKFELARVQLRIKEQKSGVYNFKNMYKAAKIKPHRLDCATFIGAVKVQDIAGKGRGLVTTKDVKAGDLLFCEKAFSYGYYDSSETKNSGGNTGILVNLATNRVTIGTHVARLTDMYQKLQNNPSTAATVHDLYSGSYKRATQVSVDGRPVVDSFLIERIVSLNVFSSPLTSREAYGQDRQADDPRFGSTGLWVYAAYINHSCIVNCYRTFIGDMMIARAAKDMPAGTELEWSYADPINRAKTKRSLQDNWGFTCTCPVCADDAKTPKKLKTKRQQILASMSTRDPRTAALEMAKTYLAPAIAVPRFELFQLYLTMAQHLVFRDGDGGGGGKAATDQGLFYALQALDALGFVVEGVDLPTGRKRDLVVRQWGAAVQPLVHVWETLWAAWAVGNPKWADDAERYWKISYAVVRAGESDTFEATYQLKQKKEKRDQAILKDLQDIRV
ncbi:hypothetical protein LZ554_005934 [Drepanopeziza brunnea f. sp. 'monogermtubi']|nr:hypothetical protein LZ554_005934 [Drepanopeziza brunnea f. sp. 'monogermtubi']